MSNSSFDVDDILNEVRKRREENEKRVKEAAENDENKSADNIKSEKTPDFEEIKTETANYEEKIDSAENTIDEERIEDEYADITDTEENTRIIEDIYEETDDSESAEEPGQEINRIFDDSEEEVDLLKLSEISDHNAEAPKKKKSKKSKIIISIIFILVFAIIATGIGAYIYINRHLENATDEPEQRPATLDEWSGMEVLKEDFTPIYEDPKSEISSYKDMVKTWYYNGSPVYSTHVLNVLLIGEDTRTEEIEDDGTRADSAIIVSVNIDTGEMTLTSILRDSYCYYEVVEGDESSGRYGKINAAMADGGIDCYIRCVENMFKVNIDNYVIVNFASFEKIIDTLGGVTVEMTKAEINEINNHPKRYGYVTIDGEPGELHLNGEQALAYCRIRKIDSDGARADRQKTVLLQMFEKAKDASTVKILEVANAILPNVKTGFNKSEVISIAKYALKHGWLDFSTQTCTVPANETDENGAVITTCKGGTFYGVWCWKVDYPLSAQLMQQRIYGKTNIVLAERRANFLDLK